MDAGPATGGDLSPHRENAVVQEGDRNADGCLGSNGPGLACGDVQSSPFHSRSRTAEAVVIQHGVCFFVLRKDSGRNLTILPGMSTTSSLLSRLFLFVM
jgi:hypothetical protein